MDVIRFDALATKVGLGSPEHLEHLHSVLRPAVDIAFVEDPRRSRSRFGGSPDLPPGTAWPEHKLGPYAFLGQVDFAEVAQACGGATGLPDEGLLSVFFEYDEKGESFWRDPGYVKAWLYPTGTKLATVNPPKVVTLGESVTLQFTPTVDLPYNKDQCPGWHVPAEVWEKHRALRKQLHPHDDYLLGYPAHCTLGYDPSPGPEWTHLLNVCSHEKLGWGWHDGDRLMVFVESARLREADFSSLTSDAG